MCLELVVLPKISMMRNIAKAFFQITSIVIDFFYPPFSRFMTIQFFRYGTVGSINLVIDWVSYYLIYQFVLQKQMLELGFVTISSHIATMIIKFPFMLMLGFLMQKYITFSASEIPGKTQLFRYFLTVMVNLAINYIGLKILVDHMGFYPTPSNMLVTIFTILVSYLSQKHFTFKTVSTKDNTLIDDI